MKATKMKLNLYEAILEAVKIEPCHITGMHDPTHFWNYTCEHQKSEAFDRIHEVISRYLNGGILGGPQRKLHGKDCIWCYPTKRTHGKKAKARRDEVKRWLQFGPPVKRTE